MCIQHQELQSGGQHETRPSTENRKYRSPLSSRFSASLFTCTSWSLVNCLKFADARYTQQVQTFKGLSCTDERFAINIISHLPNFAIRKFESIHQKFAVSRQTRSRGRYGWSANHSLSGIRVHACLAIARRLVYQFSEALITSRAAVWKLQSLSNC